MCHRYGIRANPEQIAVSLHPDLLIHLPFIPQNDVYPLANVPVIREADNGDWEMLAMQWGLLPFWWKPGIGSRSAFQRKVFNARSETIDVKPSFRAAFKQRRCIIPATEFYEKGFYYRLSNSPVLAMAGLWESCLVDGETIESYTIVTTTANSLVGKHHHRMPVILPYRDARRLWMSPDIAERPPLEELFQPIDPGIMSHHQAND